MSVSDTEARAGALRPYFGFFVSRLLPGDRIGHLLHQPLGGGRSTADTDGFGSFEPFGTQLRSLFDVIAAGIGPATHFEKDPAVARLAAADEDNYVESPCELLEVTFAIGYLAADRVVGEDLRRVGGPAAHPVAKVLEQGTETAFITPPITGTDAERLAAYLKPRFAGAKQEKALLLSLDSRSRVKGVCWLKEGNSRMVGLEVKDVVSAALRGGTESVVLCHNHPNGVPLPSREDLAATENIVRALGLVKIRLRDHIILAENDYFSMRESNRLPFYDFETGTMLRPYGRE